MNPDSPLAKTVTPFSISKVRWASALLVGALLWFIGLIASEIIPKVFLGLELEGPTFALVGAIRLVLGIAAISVGLRIANLRFTDIGLTGKEWRTDALIGTAVALTFALLQFFVIIPNTGGASRSDVAANAAQIGNAPWGVFGFMVLAWTGAFSEELFFRGFFVTTLWSLLGGSRRALVVTFVAVIVLFAAGHGYQGWAGVIDTGFYGGLVMTLLYLWRGRLTACIVAHAAWNTLATAAIYLWY